VKYKDYPFAVKNTATSYLFNMEAVFNIDLLQNRMPNELSPCVKSATGHNIFSPTYRIGKEVHASTAAFFPSIKRILQRLVFYNYLTTEAPSTLRQRNLKTELYFSG